MPEEELKEAEETEDLWKLPGFHRPLGGILYNLIYVFVAAGFGILITTWLLPNVVYPFPQAMGLENITTSIFMIFFTILDLGIGSAIDRFVAAEKVKSPRKSLQYIQFFIWYQSFSGLIQISAIAIYVFHFLPEGELAYAGWLFLVYSLIQYPGFLGVFRGSLEAFQRFDKANLIGFLQFQVFENFFRVIFILIGRQWGLANPQIGEMMGAAMGSLLGRDVKDYVSAILAAIWLRPIIHEIAPESGMLALFYVEFDKEIIKKCLFFGFKVLIPSLIHPLSSIIAVGIMVRWLPNYSTILGLFTMGDMFAYLVTTFQFPGVAAVISESYHNDKLRLTKYYVQQFFHWSSGFAGFMIGMLFAGANVIALIAGPEFELVGPIIQHLILFKLFEMLGGIFGGLFIGVGKPEYTIILNGVEQAVRLGVLLFLLVVVPSGWMALVYSFGFGWVARFIVGYFLFDRKIFKIKINIWQSFVAVFLAASVEAIGIYILFESLGPIIFSAAGEMVGAILMLLIGIFTGPFILYFPAYAWLGGFDQGSLTDLENAMELSGPSKPIINFIYKVALKFTQISPLHGRFPIDKTGVDQEALELEEMEEKATDSIK